MIVYQGTKAVFIEDVLLDRLDTKLLHYFKEHLGHGTGKSEIESWKNSLLYMEKVLNDREIPEDCGVAIEYQIPQTSKRLDFILTGSDASKSEYAVLIELKQWSSATLSNKDAIVNTFIGGKIREQTHPSYQAWSYSELLIGFNKTVQDDKINLYPCAYLHNYEMDDVIRHEVYSEYINQAPVFLRGEAVDLRDFIKKYVKYGDKTKILYRIEQGEIRPSKMLADSLAKMVEGSREFVMIDDQKVVYETALSMSEGATANKKKVLIVKGGPGTGKTVVAINLLTAITKKGLLAKYVSKNAAPREVYQVKLTGTKKKTVIGNMFGGSGAYVATKPNLFDTLIVDEAHRLNEKSGLYSNLGENQIKEIINAARTTVFFIDEDQRVTLKDIGTIDDIKKWAVRADADVVEMELQSQFRCNGADGYIAWLDNTLQIRETANLTLENIDYEFKIFSSPQDLRDAIREQNITNNKSRIVAGYCWDWNSKNQRDRDDVIIPEFDFSMKWNLTEDGSKWIIGKESVNQVGCIHTCQGLELDYVGVIVGKDMIANARNIATDAGARSKNDRSVLGYKKLMKQNPKETKAKLDIIIKNTYRTLMTRGMKGCYVYFEDKQLELYFKRKMKGLDKD